MSSNNINGLDPEYAVRLHKMLDRYFNEQELRSLMFGLGVEYDSLLGAGVSDKARELIGYMNRRGRLVELLQAVNKERPAIIWPYPPQYEPFEKKNSPTEVNPEVNSEVNLVSIKSGLMIVGVLAIAIFFIVGAYAIYRSLQVIVTDPNTIDDEGDNTDISTDVTQNIASLNKSDREISEVLKNLNVPTDTLLAFVLGSENNSSEIFTMYANGTSLNQLTNTSGQNWAPSWSYDGEWIAFTSDRDNNNEIYIISADGKREIRITETSFNEWFPSWSPDGKSLVYYSDRDGNREIYTISLDTEQINRLTNHPANDVYPAWSPDGNQIAFTSERDGKAAIYIVNIDGTGLHRLTNPVAESWFPAWSPEGTSIAFHSNISGNFQLYTIRPDGTDQTRLTENLANDYDASWSRDGKWIVFNSDRDDSSINDNLEEREIYIMRSNGNDQIRLTFSNPIVEKWVEWQP